MFHTEYSDEVSSLITAMGHAEGAVILWGPPGGGKTAFVTSYAAIQDRHLEVIVGSTREPTDFLGLPVLHRGEEYSTTTAALPDWFIRLRESGDGILFLDELTTSPPNVQAAMLTLIQSRHIGGVFLPPGVLIIAAANPPEQAADGWTLAPPLANRLCHVDWNPPVEDFLFGLSSGWGTKVSKPELIQRARLASFLRRQPQMVYDLPVHPDAAGKAWPSRRTWDRVATALGHLPEGSSEHLAARLTAGLVGEAAAMQYVAWAWTLDLPDPQEVLDAAERGRVEVNWEELKTDQVFALLTSLVSWSAQTGKLATWNACCTVFEHASNTRRVQDATAALIPDLFRCRPKGSKMSTVAGLFTAHRDLIKLAGLDSTD